MASLATGSVNFPTIVYENAPALVEEPAHIHGARRLVDSGLLSERPHVHFGEQ